MLANIAGQGSLGAAEEFSIEQVRAQMELNFFAAAELTREVLPSMRARGSGHIVNLTSIGGLHALRGFSAYCAAKFALEGWSEALHDEFAPFGLHVTIVEPGAFRTEFSGAKNMRPAGRIDAYRPVLDPIEDYLYGTDGQQPGDPRKAAEAMIAAVDSRSRRCGCCSARMPSHLGEQARGHGRRTHHVARHRRKHGARRHSSPARTLLGCDPTRHSRDGLSGGKVIALVRPCSSPRRRARVRADVSPASTCPS